MASIIQTVYSTFWSEWFWLPEGTTWNDLRNVKEGEYYPQVSDLIIPMYLALVIFVVRKAFERYIARPLGLYFGIKETIPKYAPKNSQLEKQYKIQKFPTKDSIKTISKQTDMTSQHIERWFRMRRNQDRPSIMTRFTEASWRFFFYFTVFLYGVIVLWDKPWFTDSLHCWVGYPKHTLTNGTFWYYMIELSFYWSLMFSQFMDVKRKDFWEMFAHHCATILLLTFSWSGNFVRIGTLVLCIHDAVDYWMEAAKMAKYIKAQRLCDILFAIFGLVWFITRLVLYPTKIVRSTLFYAHKEVGFGPIYYVYNLLLLSLQILHIFWTYMIGRIAWSVIGTSKKQQEVTDIRSSDEEEISEEDNNGSVANHVNSNSVEK